MEPDAPAISRFRPSGVRANAAMVLIGLTTAAIVFSAASVVWGYAIFSNIGGVDDSDVALWSALMTLAGNLHPPLFLVAGLAFLAWLSRAVDNVEDLGGGTPDFSPRASIGWWFAPFANFVQPYRIVADVWRRMALSRRERDTTLVLAWWLLFLVSEIVLVLADRIPEPETLEELQNLLLILALGLLGTAVAGVLLIRVIWVIERRVRERSAGGGDTAAGSTVVDHAEEPDTIPAG
jgi:hypothetical protein